MASSDKFSNSADPGPLPPDIGPYLHSPSVPLFDSFYENVKVINTFPLVL